MGEQFKQEKVNIIGAGLAGLSAALTLAREGVCCRLISRAPSERAQSVMAEGGINAALDHYGEDDTTAQHREDTLRGGVFLADEEAVRGLCDAAPEIIEEFAALGVPFNVTEDGKIAQRYFGGQKKRRTAHVGSLTGKMLVSALTNEVRKYEVRGLVERFDHHAFVRLLLAPDGARAAAQEKEAGKHLMGVRIRNLYIGTLTDFPGAVLLCSGGLNGMFPGETTGTLFNTGDVTATVFAQGIALANPEMIQYHPTTVQIPGKRMLISEAARGEGGRLFVTRSASQGLREDAQGLREDAQSITAENERYYFMEERYPELKNLMPRDVVSREIVDVLRDPAYGDQVYLDLTGLSKEIWETRLSELREEIIHYLSLDPAKVPVPVSPGIHYFMGGIAVDRTHRTNIAGLYAAGECVSLYHGANRLGGNSTLAAVYGGRVAAKSVMEDEAVSSADKDILYNNNVSVSEDPLAGDADDAFNERLCRILMKGLGIVRDAETMQAALEELRAFEEEVPAEESVERNRLLLAEAMLTSALTRKESRGAHFRSDFPETLDSPSAVRVVFDGADLQCQVLDIHAE